jgi:hypothetical protein
VEDRWRSVSSAALIGARLLGASGTLQREGEVLHLVVARLYDYSRLLGDLTTRSTRLSRLSGRLVLDPGRVELFELFVLELAQLALQALLLDQLLDTQPRRGGNLLAGAWPVDSSSLAIDSGSNTPVSVYSSSSNSTSSDSRSSLFVMRLDSPLSASTNGAGSARTMEVVRRSRADFRHRMRGHLP